MDGARVRRRTQARRIAVWLMALIVAHLVVACENAPPDFASLPASTAPTIEATLIPGSAADAESAVEVVQNFEEAITERNELVALLLLTPQAQKRVAASDLTAFVPPAWRNDVMSGCRAILEQDRATVSCEWSSQGSPPWLRVSLLRLNGAWKIDGVESSGLP